MNERELKEKEQQLAQKEQKLDRREKELDGFSAAMDARKKQLYGKLPVTLKQVDTVLWIACGALAVVVLLIILEAAGVFKIGEERRGRHSNRPRPFLLQIAGKYDGSTAKICGILLQKILLFLRYCAIFYC